MSELSDKELKSGAGKDVDKNHVNTGSDKPNPENLQSSSTLDPENSNKENLSLEALRQYLAQKLWLTSKSDEENSDSADELDAPPLFSPLNFDSLMEHWKLKGFKNIITMVGAGISTSAGIPDFRSPETGLYNNLQKYNLPNPTAIFQLDYFKKNPLPFFGLAKELYPGSFKPTPCHYFVKLLEEKNLLLRHYSQNIDTLERIAGISGEKLVEAHGTFFSNHCLKCRKAYDMDFVKEKVFSDIVPKCKCGGIVKPDIVFFGENLPDRFHDMPEEDFKKCDLLIIMGTSLEVQPFASLVSRVNSRTPRLLINREIVGGSSLWYSDGLDFDKPNNKRDIAWLGDCDEGVQKIAEYLDFGDELIDLVKREHAKIDDEDSGKKVNEPTSNDKKVGNTSKNN